MEVGGRTTTLFSSTIVVPVHTHTYLESLTTSHAQIREGVEYKPFNFYSRSVLRINVTEASANYTCYAINQMVGGRQSSDQRSFMVYLDTEKG